MGLREWHVPVRVHLLPPLKARQTTSPTQHPLTHNQQALEPSALEPTRLSRRLRGETAPALSDVAAAARAEAEAEGRARRGATRKRLTVEPGVQLAAPFSLWSIGAHPSPSGRGREGFAWEGLPCTLLPGLSASQGDARMIPSSTTHPPTPPQQAGVTVWELGQVHRGAWAHRYWSSSGCLYHHAYPVGFRATKVCAQGSVGLFVCVVGLWVEGGGRFLSELHASPHVPHKLSFLYCLACLPGLQVQFGRTYEMRIEEGPTGPMFKVCTAWESGVVESSRHSQTCFGPRLRLAPAASLPPIHPPATRR